MRQAFSLVELLVVIAVAMIVISLALPMLQASLMQAKLTRWLAATSQHGSSIMMYATNHKDVYPIAHWNAWGSSQRWHEPLIMEGFYESAESVDPEGTRKIGMQVYWMSRSMLEDPVYALQGKTRPPDEQRPSPVGQYQVVFPSSKGLLLQSAYPRMPLQSAFTDSGPYYNSPGSFADGSAMIGNRLDFNLGLEPSVDENSYGVPIWSTWGGYRSRDR